jgi:hypothetical protein
MPRRSTRTDKTIYQISREKAGLTREAAGLEMEFISDDRIENIESGRSQPQPEDILEMARVYHDPLLCNAYCSTQCSIGRKYVPQLTEKELSQITLEVLEAVNALYSERERLVSIAVDGRVSDSEMEDFIRIRDQLRKLAASSNTLQLWMERSMGEEDVPGDD